MLKEQGPQTDFSGALNRLSHEVICIHFIPGLWSAYYIMSRKLCVCVCVCTAVGGERDHALFKPLLSGNVCSKPHSSVQKRAALFSPKGRCKLIATVCRINTSLLLGESLKEKLCLEFDAHAFSLSRGIFKTRQRLTFSPHRGACHLSAAAETWRSVKFEVWGLIQHWSFNLTTMHMPAWRVRIETNMSTCWDKNR